MRLTVAALLLLGATAAGAHELGGVKVAVVFEPGGSWRADVLVHPSHLPPPADDAPAPPPIAAGLEPDVARRVGPFLVRTLEGSRVVCDTGTAGAAEQALVPASEPAPAGEMAAVGLRLRGRLPRDARSCAWQVNAGTSLAVVTLQNGDDGVAVRHWIPGGITSPALALDERVRPLERSAVVRQYLWLGFTHILPLGLDHILFVLGLFLLSTKLKPLLVQVTAFTLAHTLTLALTVYGKVALSPAIVEPLIALSIVYVAIENVLLHELRPWRPVIVFLFGLLHGMGFAGVLSEIGLPRGDFLTALLSFNVGVEAGQLAVILLAAVLIGLPSRGHDWYRSRVVVPGSLLIAAVGAYWFVERVFSV